MKENILQFSIRVDRILLQKFRYISELEYRSANKEIVQYLKKRVEQFEEEQGEIILEKKI